MNSQKLSSRQLAVAVITGGLSSGAAAAGRADWRWLLLAAVLGVALGALLLRRVGNLPLHPALRAAYAAWAVVLMADVLTRSAERLQAASGGGTAAGWFVALLALPLAWMGWGRGAAFFRAAEISWLAMAAAIGAILLLGLPRIHWSWVLPTAGDWKDSLGAGVVMMSTGLYAFPLLYMVEPEAGGKTRGLAWLGTLGLLSSALALLTAGLLSPAVAALLDNPFFGAAGLLGDSARLEGLVSALWLLPDLTLAGLLSRAWGERRWPALGVLAALGLSLTGALDLLPREILPIGCLTLGVLTAAVPPEEKK